MYPFLFLFSGVHYLNGIQSTGYASVPYGGKEIRVDSYEVLCGSGFSWVPGSNGWIPANAVLGGNIRAEGYIGRVYVDGVMQTGKISTDFGWNLKSEIAQAIKEKLDEILNDGTQKA